MAGWHRAGTSMAGAAADLPFRGSRFRAFGGAAIFRGKFAAFPYAAIPRWGRQGWSGE